MPEMDMILIDSNHKPIVSAMQVVPTTSGYQYDVNDQLRNNRPGVARPKSSHNSEKESESLDHSSNGKIDQSSLVSVKTPRMPSTFEDFDVIGTIGTGSYGTCKKIRRKKDGKVMVWKEMEYGSMTESEKQMLVSEVNLLRELRHQHIVRYYDRIIDRTQAIIYIIMEYCEGGDLASIISRNRKDGTHVSEDFAWKILIQATLALKECHRRKNGKAVLHRDLKPANVFLDADANVKLELDMIIRRMIQVEVMMRPSIDSILADSVVQRKQDSLNKKNANQKKIKETPSSGRMSGSGDRNVPVTTPDSIATKMRQLALKEKELESRERSLAIREKLADDKMKRAMEILGQCRCGMGCASGGTTQRLGRLSPCSAGLSKDISKVRPAMGGELTYTVSDDAETDSVPISPPSSLTSAKTKDSDSPKKHVTFYNILNGDENLRQKLNPVFRHDANLYPTPQISRDIITNSSDFLFRVPGVSNIGGLTSRGMITKYTRRDFGLLNFR
ncbi:serine/threonine-protein kinase nek2-like [Plakobranchus ocellatus]|uniref:non-specific serine/threonine protein kinase n=1 Tax=Plakobranchus ocellatus TaxID=259542 RepID=A0AAV4C5U2_9GAST|nr:serine/threonine-protein kinase nek2-like [Plakobranchus ocellatus]